MTATKIQTNKLMSLCQCKIHIWSIQMLNYKMRTDFTHTKMLSNTETVQFSTLFIKSNTRWSITSVYCTFSLTHFKLNLILISCCSKLTLSCLSFSYLSFSSFCIEILIYPVTPAILIRTDSIQFMTSSYFLA